MDVRALGKQFGFYTLQIGMATTEPLRAELRTKTTAKKSDKKVNLAKLKAMPISSFLSEINLSRKPKNRLNGHFKGMTRFGKNPTVKTADDFLRISQDHLLNSIPGIGITFYDEIIHKLKEYFQSNSIHLNPDYYPADSLGESVGLQLQRKN